MRPPYGVVGGWATGLLMLALALLAFTRHLAVFVMYLAATGLVACFGLVVLLATRRGAEHAVQRRQPRRATAAVFAALAAGVAASGLAYGWVVALSAIYPLGVALWMLRGERLPAGARPWPVSTDGMPPAEPAPLPYQGQTTGTAEPVPPGHPAAAAPDGPTYPTRAERDGPIPAVAKAGWVVIGARVLARLLRGGR